MTIRQHQLPAQHVVAIPYPAQGHINPMLQLCHQLAPLGFTFTFVNTQHIHNRVQDAKSADVKEAQAHAGGDEDAKANNIEINTLEIQAQQRNDPIRMVFVEGGCAPEVHAHVSTIVEAFMAAQEMKEQAEQLISDIMEEQSVAFILTDILLGWSEATANKFGLPWVCFWSASAATCAAFIYFADLGEQGRMTVPIADKQDIEEVPTIEGIAGLPPTRLHDVPKVWDDEGKVHHGFLNYFQRAQSASFLLFNTFTELEGEVLQALKSKGYPTLAVGPLLPARYICPNKTASKLELDGAHESVLCRSSLFREDRSCLQWLDTQEPSSVLFISFGSISARSPEQLEELALAVEATGCPFLWVRKPDVLAGFTPETSAQYCGRRENGLIVPWAPQLEVLSHPAVGGFVTHCGWNSVMESVAMGVPMLCWADNGERMSNQRFVVEFWKCGLDVVSDGQRRYKQNIEESALVRRDEIERAIRVLMLEEAGVPIRARAASLRHSATLAFGNGRSQFNYFVESIRDQKILRDAI